MSKTLWKGSFYYRYGRLKGERSSWRNRNTGKTIDGGRNLSINELRRRSGKNEPTRANPYGRAPRSRIQAQKDTRSFGSPLRKSTR